MAKVIREVPDIDVEKLRDILGLSWEELGNACGVGRQYMWMIGKGERLPTPTMRIVLYYIAKEAGVVQQVRAREEA